MFSLFKTFVAVYETKSFTRAAQQLYFSQPTVTVRIKKLEEELGTSLFFRGKNHEVIPSEAANQLYNRVVDLLEQWSKIERDLQQNTSKRQSFKVAVSHSVAGSVMPQIFQEFMPEINHLEMEISTFNSDKVFDLVSNHELHLGIIEKPLMGAQTNTFSIYDDELVLAGNLESDLFFIREKGSGVNHYTEQFLKECESIPKSIVTMNSNELIVNHLKAGFGASIISKRFINNEIPFVRLGEKYKRVFYGVTYLDEYQPSIKNLTERIRILGMKAKED
ncbi:MAG: LysR family transcriptional regulator [Streptococcaceae bacterium]|nr:LysR family transcriptional regulator [Streptococcaceae bacterium]